MALFKRRGQAAAVPLDELLGDIGRLTEANRAAPDRDTERRLLSLRHDAGLQRIAAKGRGGYAQPDPAGLPEGPGLPEFSRDQVTPGLLRAGILRDGCLLVRGLVGRDEALAFAARIDRAFAERERVQAGEPAEPGFYEEYDSADVASVRPWIQEGGGVLATDAPMLTFEMLEMFARAGLPELVGGYLGEPPLLSMQKTTLRKAEPAVGGAWHQDGAFMGDVRALNLWLSLSRCGDEAPGLDVVPRRLEEIVIDHDAMLVVDVTRAKAEEAARGVGIVRPIFEPGDALFFDEMFLHQTGSDPSMPNPRFAIESWFFGGSAFPADYAPVAV